MTSVCDVLLVVLVASTGPLLLVLKSTLTDATHPSGAVVLQVTLAAGVGPSTLSPFTVTVDREKSTAACIRQKCKLISYMHDGVS